MAAHIDWWAKEALSKNHHNKESCPNKQLVEKSIEQWHRAASHITHFPHFDSNWSLPAFYFWYKRDLKSQPEDAMQHTANGEYTTKQIKDFCKNVHVEINKWKKMVKDMYYLKDGLFQKVCGTTNTSQKNNTSKSMTQVSGITKHASMKISTDNALKKGEPPKVQDGKIQLLEQEEHKGMTQQSNQMNQRIMKKKTKRKLEIIDLHVKANKQEE